MQAEKNIIIKHFQASCVFIRLHNIIIAVVTLLSITFCRLKSPEKKMTKEVI